MNEKPVCIERVTPDALRSKQGKQPITFVTATSNTYDGSASVGTALINECF